jgi:hypothetical protein
MGKMKEKDIENLNNSRNILARLLSKIELFVKGLLK